MGKMPDALRETIARNIRDCRMNKFPGRGGGKRCAESFGVSPQQWSPWESGKRTPDELRLEQIANFFGTTVEWFRRDHRQDMAAALAPAAGGGDQRNDVVHTHIMGTEITRAQTGLLTESEQKNIAHYLWLLDLVTQNITTSGIRIVVTFEKADVLTNAS